DAFGAPLRPAILDRKGAALDPAEVMQSRHKSCRPSTPGRRVRAYKPDRRQFTRLLRARRERPRRRRAAEQRDELAAFQSITSSARRRKDSGILSPIAFAVVRLKNSSNLVGWTTGRSAGLSPLRMRPT